jgi:intraflagellar transport protein 80
MGWSLCREQVYREIKASSPSLAPESDDTPAGSGEVKDLIPSGSLLDICWAYDNSLLAAGTADGGVVFGQLVGRRIEWRNLNVVHADPDRCLVHDVLTDKQEEINPRDKIVRMSLGYGFLILATTTQVQVYDTNSLQMPNSFDVKDTVSLICQSERSFLILDMHHGIRIFAYDGHSLCTLQAPNIRLEFLNPQSISLSPDRVAVKDTFNPKKTEFFETATGRISEKALEHTMAIIEVALNQFGTVQDRKLVFVDANKDLYIVIVSQPQIPSMKLASMVSSIKWNDYSETLIAIADGKLATWNYPGIVFIDRDLLPLTKHLRTETEFGKNDIITQFFGFRCAVRRGNDGARLTFMTSPYPIMLFTHVGHKQWGEALRLCRFVKEVFLWALLAAIAVKEGRLLEAEDAYAAIGEPDKVYYIQFVKSIPSPEGRAAQLALLQRRPEEAEQILIGAGLLYRAIKLHIDLFEWEKALGLACQYKTHIDTVLGFRQKYLSKFNKQETSPQFIEIQKAVEIDWDKIDAKIQKEETEEKSRPGAGEYKGD